MGDPPADQNDLNKRIMHSGKGVAREGEWELEGEVEQPADAQRLGVEVDVAGGDAQQPGGPVDGDEVGPSSSARTSGSCARRGASQ